MNQPTPAIVAQSAVRRLPRWSLLLLCLAYVVPGYVLRGPWRSSDMEAFGYMREMALDQSSWLQPQLAAHRQAGVQSRAGAAGQWPGRLDGGRSRERPLQPQELPPVAGPRPDPRRGCPHAR